MHIVLMTLPGKGPVPQKGSHQQQLDDLIYKPKAAERRELSKFMKGNISKLSQPRSDMTSSAPVQ